MMDKCTNQDQKLNEATVKETEANTKIKVVDNEGYDIEQFLCRCSNKTSPKDY